MLEKPMTTQQYANMGGLHCPLCGSKNIAGDSPSADGPTATADEWCRDCGGAWVSIWRVTGYYLNEPDDTEDEGDEE